MKKILFFILVLFPGLCSAGSIGDALKNFVEKSKHCDELSLQIKDAEEKSDVDLVQKLKTEFDEMKCSIKKEIDGTGGVEEISDSETQTKKEPVLCSDGTEPDEHGCCTGEVYTDMGDGVFVCCPPGDGACYEPFVK